MEKTQKLKMVFDFIADYLSEESTQKEETLIDNIIDNVDDKSIVEVNINEDDDPLKRSYAIIQKLEERDKAEAKFKIDEQRKKFEIKLTKLNEKRQRQDTFIKENKHRKAKILCYDDETFMPIFLSEDESYAITVDNIGFEITMTLEEVYEKYPNVKPKVEESSERSGITLDDNGNLVKIKVPNLYNPDQPESSIMPVMSKKLDLEDYNESESPNNID